MGSRWFQIKETVFLDLGSFICKGGSFCVYKKNSKIFNSTKKYNYTKLIIPSYL